MVNGKILYSTILFDFVIMIFVLEYFVFRFLQHEFEIIFGMHTDTNIEYIIYYLECNVKTSGSN